MDDYIKGNKAAWEEAFDNRAPGWGEDIVTRVQKEDYAFFIPEAIDALKKYDLRGKSIAQLCCNNGRELMSLVRTTGAKQGVGFDIAENQIAFAAAQAKTLSIPCDFVAANILDIGREYDARFDFILITIGALCWFEDLRAFFRVASRLMRPGAAILIHEVHPYTCMLSADGEEDFDKAHPLEAKYSYFQHVFLNNEGMSYLTGKSYESKTFTDFSHPLCDITGAMKTCGIRLTALDEFDRDISGCFPELSGQGFPLSILLEGEKA